MDKIRKENDRKLQKKKTTETKLTLKDKNGNIITDILKI